MKTKRNAIRLGNPHSIESVSRVVDRYGALTEKTRNKLVQWLDKHSKEYKYRLINECGNITLVTQFKGSIIEKFIDNEKDGQICLDNLS